MRMTIAEPIQTLEYLRDSGVFPFSSKEGVNYTVESIDVAIETMRKYQKIEQIRHRVKYTDLEPAKAYELINEVLADGKDIF